MYPGILCSGNVYGGFKIVVQKVFEKDLSRDGICKILKFSCIETQFNLIENASETDCVGPELNS